MTNDYSRTAVLPVLRDLAAAFMLLTRIPVPWSKLSSQPPDLKSSVWAYPIVGLVVGSIGGCSLWIATALNLNAGIAGVIALIAMILATGAFHEDGLADVADGFGGGATRERKLEIMRDSRIGTYGTLALVLVLGLKIGALSSLPALPAMAALIVSAVVSRAMIVAALYVLPSARKDSLAADAGKPGVARLTIAILIACLVLAGLLNIGTAIFVVAASTLAAGLMGWISMRQIDGYSGDVLGAIQQVSETVVLLVLSALWGFS